VEVEAELPPCRVQTEQLREGVVEEEVEDQVLQMREERTELLVEIREDQDPQILLPAVVLVVVVEELVQLEEMQEHQFLVPEVRVAQDYQTL
jgi:hypothetical protein